MFFLKTALKRSQHQAFNQRYDQVNPGQHALFVGRFVLENLIMAISLTFQTIERFPAVGDNGAAGGNVVLDKRHQLIGRTIIDDFSAHAAKLFVSPFNRYGHRAFVQRTAAAFSAVFATKVKFIGFHPAAKQFTVFSNRASAQLLQPAPGRAIAAQPQKILEVHRVDTGFAGGKPPHGLEPIGQWFSGAMKDRSGRQRVLAFAAGANQQATGTFPISGMASVATNIAIWKAALKQIRITGLLICKTGIEFSLVFGKIFRHCKFVHF